MAQLIYSVLAGNATVVGYVNAAGLDATIQGAFTIPSQVTGYFDSSGNNFVFDEFAIPPTKVPYDSTSGFTLQTFPVTAIGNQVFLQKWQMTSVSLPSTLVTIGLAAFYASGLTSVTIPSSVQTIKQGAFKACGDLAVVDFLGTRPSTLEMECFFGIPAPYASVPSSWSQNLSNIGPNGSNGGTDLGLPVQIATRLDPSFFPNQLNVYNAAAGGYISPLNIAVKGPYIYATGETSGFVSRINLIDGSANKVQWANVGDSNGYITVDGSYLYFASRNASNISKVNLSDGSVASPTWATGLDKLTAITANGNYIYATSFSNSNVSRINLSDGTIANAPWATGLTKPGGIAFDASYAYVTYNSGLGAITGGNVFGGVSKINLSDGTVANATWATGMWRPTGIAVSGAYAYVLNSGGTLGTTNYVVSQINLSDGSVATSNVATATLAPAALAGVVSVDGSYGYIGSTSNFYISRFILPTPTSYTLTFDSQLGSAVSAVTQPSGSVSKPADPTRAGYTFNGWFAAASGGSALSWPYSMTTNVTLYAQWSQNAAPAPPSSGSAAGDPYVSTVTNKIYKLPAFNGALRLYQGTVNGEQLTVNATTRIDDDKQAMDADNSKMNSKLTSPVAHNLEMAESMSFFDKIHVQLGDAHVVFSVYDGFRQLSPLPVGWTLADKGTVADYLSGLPFYAHLAGSVHELSPCEGVTIRMGIVPIRHIRSTVEVAAPNMAAGSGALVHRLARKQMSLKKLTDMKPIAAAKDAPVRRTLREAFVCDRATTHADIAFLG